MRIAKEKHQVFVFVFLLNQLFLGKKMRRDRVRDRVRVKVRVKV
jgi:hypothetical protein